MTATSLECITVPLAHQLHANHMSLLDIRRTMQLAYVLPGELIMTPEVYPVRETDSRLRRLVLDNNALA